MDNTNLPFNERDIFRGYTTDDVSRIEKILAKNISPHPEFHTDAIGVRVDPHYCPWVAPGQVATGAPIPTDGYCGDGIEYAALGMAIEAAAGNDVFTVVEIGAGWGPWVSAGAKVALRAGFKQVRMIALEADAPRFQTLRRHLAINELVLENSPNEGVNESMEWRLHQAAIGLTDGVLYWPKSDDIIGAGRSTVTDLTKPHHFSGEDWQFEEVKAFSLETVLSNIDHVDFLHIDVQGTEGALLPSVIDIIDRKVASMFVGTHSRKIEGDLIEFFRTQQWTLVREKPCLFHPEIKGNDSTHGTYVDGGQYWRNDRMK